MSDIRPEDWSEIKDALRHDLNEGRGDRARLEELLARLERGPGGPPPPAEGHAVPAPITDRIDTEEIARGHARIRAASSRHRAVSAVAGVAGVIVAAGVLGIGYNAVRPRTGGASPGRQPSRDFVNAAPASPALPALLPNTPPARRDLTVEPLAASRHSEPATHPVREARATATDRPVDDDVEIAPAPRPAERRVVRRAPVRIAAVPRKPAKPVPAPAIHAPRRLVVARATPSRRSSPSDRAKRVARAERAEAPLPRTEITPVRPPARSAPETASFTPMSKERVLPAPRRPASEARTADYATRRTAPIAAPRSAPRIARGNFDDRAEEDGWRTFERDEPRERPASREFVVKRRICVETGLLASDLCPHTAIVLMPESRVPRRVCRVHTLP